MHPCKAAAVIAFLVVSTVSQRLDKPPLQQDLNNLKQGFLSNLTPVESTRTAYKTGYIPADCKAIVQREKFNVADIKTWNVKYDDCSTPWVVCYHQKSNGTLDNLVDRLGRVPVRTRGWVRHVVTLPDDGGHAYNSGGNVAIFGSSITNLNVYLHELAHSLDLLGAFKDKPLSSSSNWSKNYNKDSNVPDPYAQTNQVENVAQNTVVTAYERNVPGGFWGIQPNADRIFYQYATVDTEQREAGKLLVKGGTCTSRLANSSPVPVSGSASAATANEAEDVEAKMPTNIKIIPGKDFNTKDSCKDQFE